MFASPQTSNPEWSNAMSYVTRKLKWVDTYFILSYRTNFIQECARLYLLQDKTQEDFDNYTSLMDDAYSMLNAIKWTMLNVLPAAPETITLDAKGRPHFAQIKYEIIE